jgi:hypothetical protein
LRFVRTEKKSNGFLSDKLDDQRNY